MASNLKKTRIITDKVSVKGVLSDDCTTITYTDENKVEQDISVAECLGIFKGEAIDFTISRKSEDEIPNESENENSDESED